MKKVIFYLLVLSLLPVLAKAQLPASIVHDPKAAALQSKSIALQQGMRTISESSVKELKNVGEYAQNAYNLAKDYQSALGLVNKYIANVSGVKNMFFLQQKIAELYANNYNKFNKNLKSRDINLYQSTLRHGLKQSLKHIQDLDIIITSDFAKMTDAERMSIISDLEKKMNYEYDGLNAVVADFKKQYNLVEFNQGTKNYIK